MLAIKEEFIHQGNTYLDIGETITLGASQEIHRFVKFVRVCFIGSRALCMNEWTSKMPVLLHSIRLSGKVQEYVAGNGYSE